MLKEPGNSFANLLCLCLEILTTYCFFLFFRVLPAFPTLPGVSSVPSAGADMLLDAEKIIKHKQDIMRYILLSLQINQ